MTFRPEDTHQFGTIGSEKFLIGERLRKQVRKLWRMVLELLQRQQSLQSASCTGVGEVLSGDDRELKAPLWGQQDVDVIPMVIAPLFPLSKSGTRGEICHDALKSFNMYLKENVS